MPDTLKFTGNTTLPISAESLLEDAKGWEMDKCLVLGWKDGEFVFGGTHCQVGENLLLLEVARTKLIEVANA
jgi:hypothetical protein